MSSPAAPAATVDAWPAALRLALRGLVALAVAMGIGRFAFTPQLPLMQADMGLSLSAGGWLAGANYLGYLVGALLAARQGLPAVRLLHWGLWAVALSTLAMALPGPLAWWLLMRFIAGVASAWVLIGTATLVLARLTQAGFARLDGLVFSGVGTGIALAGLLCLGGALAGLHAAALWLVLGGLALSALTVVRARTLAGPAMPVPTPANVPNGSAQTETKTDAKKEAQKDPAKESAKEPANAPTATGAPGHLRLLMLCYGLFGFGYILPATYLPSQARALLADPALFGLVWPLFGAAAALSTLGMAALARWPRTRSWAVAHGVMALGVVLPACMPGLAALAIAACCVGGTFMVITVLGLQEARLQAGERAQQSLAGMTAAFACGQLAGPIAANALLQWGWTLDAALWLACAALLLSALCLLSIRSVKVVAR